MRLTAAPRRHVERSGQRLTRSTGGKKILQRVAGKDASKQFWKYHNEGVLKKYKPQLHIGSLDSKPQSKAQATPKPAPAPPKKAAAPKEVKKEVKSHVSEALDPFGDGIPFSDPAWYQSVCRTYLLTC